MASRSARYFRDNINALICLDEVQRKPEIFPLLRSIIDEHNRKPRFLILGSASPDLLKQSSESLAGRIRYFELSPFNYSEINQIELSTFWLRGGYPLSFLSGTDQASYEWRESFISTYLERDLPNLGFRRTSALVRRVWAMLAHYHGQILNKSKLSQSLDLTSQAITGYLDMLADTYMIRVIEPYYSNSKKRLVKTPKVYIRDSGILHYLLKIKTREDLYSNPNYGSSWEGLVVENILSMINQSWDVFFYRNSLGDELDLVLKYGSKIIAIECKSSSAPKLTKSNYSAISDSLNHASIIDGIRLCKAQRFRYNNNDLADLEAKLQEAKDCRYKLIATDGVFSMDGIIANLSGICDLAEKYGAMVMFDDCHAVGFMGARGRGTHEHHNVMDRVDIITGTLGKALGGASGGYTSGKKEVIEWLRQRSRPYLFSNALAPVISAVSIAVLDLLESETELKERLRANGKYFRKAMTELGFNLVPGEHPIIPVMLGEASLASKMADALLKEGVYVIGFSYPVVPKGAARIRTQMSAGMTTENLDRAIEAFEKVGKVFGVLH